MRRARRTSGYIVDVLKQSFFVHDIRVKVSNGLGYMV